MTSLPAAPARPGRVPERLSAICTPTPPAYDGIYLDSNGRIIEVACGAHIRRKFVNAQSVAPADSAQMVERFRQLYDIEDRARDLTVAERTRYAPVRGPADPGADADAPRRIVWSGVAEIVTGQSRHVCAGINGTPSAATRRTAA